MKILLKSARIIDKNSSFNDQVKDILIENGVFVKIANKITKPNNCKEIKFENLHVSNGWFDSSVSFGEPGYEERETIEHGLDVAAKSGFTCVAVNPNTDPFIDNKSVVEFVNRKSYNSAVQLFPIANLTKNADGENLAELYDMHKSGAIAFGDYNRSISNANLMKIALLYAQNFDGLILSFPQDKSIATLGSVNESENTTRLGLKSLPNLSEELQIVRDLFLLEYTGGKLHIPTVSTTKSLKLIREAKKKGLDVTCSVTPHHLILNDEELKSFDSNFKVIPPLRSETDNKALLKGIEDGTIDMITSDHNPIDIENKNVEFENGMFGTIGLESLFGSINNVLNLDQTISCLTNEPRKRFNIPPNQIKIGGKAEITLFDPEVSYIFSKKNILSKSKNSAFLGKALKGIAYGIIANDKLVLK
jgi:dihydroorotase